MALYGKESCSIHYINYDNLYNYVLSRLQHWSKLCEADEQEMLKYLIKDGVKHICYSITGADHDANAVNSGFYNFVKNIFK